MAATRLEIEGFSAAVERSSQSSWFYLWHMVVGQCKRDVTPVLMHWSYISLALAHHCIVIMPNCRCASINVLNRACFVCLLEQIMCHTLEKSDCCDNCLILPQHSCTPSQAGISTLRVHGKQIKKSWRDQYLAVNAKSPVVSRGGADGNCPNDSIRLVGTLQGWGEYSTYQYEYWKISTRVLCF